MSHPSDPESLVFRKIDHIRTADAAMHQIEELVLGGVLRPGDRLPAERDLAAEMDVSRPVLRDALKTLEQQGLLTSRQGGGTFVADIIGPVFSEPVVALIERHPKAISDYLEFRLDMESLAASHAAERATAADHEILRDLIDRMTAAFASDDLQLEAELDIEFHQAVSEAAHNVILLHSMRSCYRLLQNGVFFNRERLYSHPDAREHLLDQHRHIADRIIAGDAAGASAAAAAHIRFVRQAIEAGEEHAARSQIADIRLQRHNQTPSQASPARRKTLTSS